MYMLFTATVHCLDDDDDDAEGADGEDGDGAVASGMKQAGSSADTPSGFGDDTQTDSDGIGGFGVATHADTGTFGFDANSDSELEL